MFEELSGVALHLEGGAATHQPGDLSPPPTELSLQIENTLICSISHMTTWKQKPRGELTSPSANNSFSWGDHRVEEVEDGLVGNLKVGGDQ